MFQWLNSLTPRNTVMYVSKNTALVQINTLRNSPYDDDLTEAGLQPKGYCDSDRVTETIQIGDERCV